MFEITPDDISLIGDEDLRTLVGLLCEAEARKRGLPTSTVTYGGDQNATDGGVDVRVTFPAGTAISGFVPREATGFQAKAKDMPRADILEEMCPGGIIRPAIQELADQSGAYIIVSSQGSISDTALQRRGDAMTEAIQSLGTASALAIDFYDRTRLATWARDHAGVSLWVKSRIGKAISGWQSYGAWAYPSEGVTGEYLLDDKLRIQTGKDQQKDWIPAPEGIKLIREALRGPRSVVRLVGLSGVGKTRFVQALFDDRIGENPLDSSRACYTNIADGPDPQPMGLASDLIAAQTKAILVIDNCASELHGRLSTLCRSCESSLSVITVEYDIREDEPEGTDVFTLEPSSSDLIEKLIKKRFEGLSAIDAQTVAKFSDGNARIAITLAETVADNETIAHLNDEELFHRLFYQRHQPDESLLSAAESCSLVYSFQGEDVSNSSESELFRLSEMAGIEVQQLFRNVADLKRRGLVQQRGVWRAVLPHAVANRLAARALQNIPPATIQVQLVRGAPDRLLKSFSRRLGYLDTSKEAITLVRQWFGEGGMLGDVAQLNELGRSMFNDVAPVAPEEAVSALERALLSTEDEVRSCLTYIYVLRSIAYDPLLFDRCVVLIAKLVQGGEHNAEWHEGRKLFASLFWLHLSGTHATLEQRLSSIESLLLSDIPKRRSLGSMALTAALETHFFDTSHRFEFGAHSRDYGYWPKDNIETKSWFESVLRLVERVGCSDGPAASLVREVLAEKFGGLWTHIWIYDELDRVCRVLRAKEFWPEGWRAIRETQHFHSKGFVPEISVKLASLEDALRPTELAQRVRSIVLSNHWRMFDLDFTNSSAATPQERMDQMEAASQDLGKAVATDESVLEELMLELLSSEGRLLSFGRGLAQTCANPEDTWNQMVTKLASIEEGHWRVEVLCGFLNALYAKSPDIANALLDGAVEDETVARVYPVLQSHSRVDRRGVDRLMRSLAIGRAPIKTYRNLSWEWITEPDSGQDLSSLLVEIAGKAGGFEVAEYILHMRLHAETDQTRRPSPELLNAGREMMRRLKLHKQDDYGDYRLGVICEACLTSDEDAEIVEDICRQLRESISRSGAFAVYCDSMLKSLFRVQPRAALDGLFGGIEENRVLDLRIANEIRILRRNPFDTLPEAELLAWCDESPESRYPAIAAAVPISQKTTDDVPPRWTTVALRLLDKAPNRIEGLTRLIGQFSPRSWSGSRVAIIESNVRLLDELETYPDIAVAEFVAREKARLRQAIEGERRQEMLMDREADETFE